MSGSRLEVGHSALKSIEDRIDRTPTAVHFIRYSSFLKFRFEDDPKVSDIIPVWKASGGRTQLWEYIFHVVAKEKQPTGSKKDEVVIITDGYDNGSAGEFRGIEGYNHLMTELKRLRLEMSHIVQARIMRILRRLLAESMPMLTRSSPKMVKTKR